MSINRIRPMLRKHELPLHHARAADTLEQILVECRPQVSQLMNEYLSEHPGEQCYLLLLDARQQIVQDLLATVYENAAVQLSAMERHARATAGGAQPDQALVVKVVPRAAGIDVVRFLAVNEEQAHASCDQLADAEAIAVCVDGSGMVVCPIDVPAADPGAAERARRQDRSRRHGR